VVAHLVGSNKHGSLSVVVSVTTPTPFKVFRVWYNTPSQRTLRLILVEAAGMLPAQILDRFIERCPAAVMVRTTLECLLRPARLDQIFEDSKQLLFSQVVAIMAAVATRTHASVHSAYLAAKDRLDVSVTALYDKLNHLQRFPLGLHTVWVAGAESSTPRKVGVPAWPWAHVFRGLEDSTPATQLHCVPRMGKSL
jgi:hypothetical protein